MPFKKGISGNQAGRSPGSKGKVQADLRERIKLFLDGNFAQIQKDFKTLDAEKKLLIYEKLLKFVLPSLKETTNTIDLSRLSESEIESVITEISKSINQ